MGELYPRIHTPRGAGKLIGRLYVKEDGQWVKAPYYIVEYDLAEHPELAGEVDPGETFIQLTAYVPNCSREISRPMAKRIKKMMEAHNA